MTWPQYRAALTRLDLTQNEAATLFGISLRTSQGYAIGEYPIPKPIADLLRFLLAGKITLKDFD